MLKLITVLAFCTVVFACITPQPTPTPLGGRNSVEGCIVEAREKGASDEEMRLLEGNPFDLTEEDDATPRAMFERVGIAEWCDYIVDFPDH